MKFSFRHRAITIALAAAIGAPLAIAATSSTASADTFTCDGLKKTLDAHLYNPLSGDGTSTASGGWIAAYITAKTMGCDLGGDTNPYHQTGVHPHADGIGKEFSLQATAHSSVCRGPIAQMGFPQDKPMAIDSLMALKGASNPSGCNSSDNRVPASTFSYIATGSTQGGRFLYKMLIESGNEAGKCLSFWDGAPLHGDVVGTAECTDDKNVIWFAPSEGSKDDALDTYKYNKGLDWGFQGVLNAHRDNYFSIEHWDGNSDQRFHYRPPGQPT
ncbi:hypothetical protein ACIBEA_30380 [Streptomyces sp. NPDC051555]|uniref:hypothetical protein n=1 Tax=Streptomyces sp. NPDC051555 TaxID=3365657 RepID=UPI00379807FA